MIRDIPFDTGIDVCKRVVKDRRRENEKKKNDGSGSGCPDGYDADLLRE